MTNEVTANSSAATRYRARVFVDFWNYELSMKSVDGHHLTDWRILGRVLVEEAARIINPGAQVEYQRMNVYGSYDQNSLNDERLKHWMTNTLDKFPGVSVSLSRRNRKASGPKCPSCHKETIMCQGCGSDMRGTEEKGVDVSIATDMIRLAWAGNYDIAVLVSSDRDFIPVAEFLETKDIKIVHGAFPPKASELTAKCWASMSLPDLRSKFERQAKPQKLQKTALKAVSTRHS